MNKSSFFIIVIVVLLIIVVSNNYFYSVYKEKTEVKAKETNIFLKELLNVKKAVQKRNEILEEQKERLDNIASNLISFNDISKN